MKIRYRILLAAWLAVPIGSASGARAQALRAKLTEALKTYCVPPSEDVCVDMAARYQNFACYCGDPTYMYYDREARRCRVKCPAGQIVKPVTVCPTAGYGARFVKDF
jgi:hypothetical protein